MFIARPTFYDRTIRESEEIKAIPALLTSPHGTTEPGTAVFAGRKLIVTLTEAGAWKLANDIADALEAIRKDNAA